MSATPDLAAVKTYLLDLNDRICAALAAEDGSRTFTERKLDFAGDRAGRGLRGGWTLKSSSEVTAAAPDRLEKEATGVVPRREPLKHWFSL